MHRSYGRETMLTVLFLFTLVDARMAPLKGGHVPSSVFQRGLSILWSASCVESAALDRSLDSSRRLLPFTARDGDDECDPSSINACTATSLD